MVQFTTIRITDGGFVLRVALKRQILDDVGLSVIFTDATNVNNSETLIQDSRGTYFDVRLINQVVSLDELPTFKSFTLQVALKRGPITGPFNNSNIVIRKFANNYKYVRVILL